MVELKHLKEYPWALNIGLQFSAVCLLSRGRVSRARTWRDSSVCSKARAALRGYVCLAVCRCLCSDRVGPGTKWKGVVVAEKWLVSLEEFWFRLELLALGFSLEAPAEVPGVERESPERRGEPPSGISAQSRPKLS